MKCKGFGRLTAVLLAASLGLGGCASAGIDSRRRDGVYSVSHQVDGTVPLSAEEVPEASSEDETAASSLSGGGTESGQPSENTEEQPSESTENTAEGESPAESDESRSAEEPAEENEEGRPAEETSSGSTEGEPTAGDGESGETSDAAGEQGFVEVIGPSGVNVEELNQKDNSRLVAGYDPNDRDERNRPRKAVNFQEIFGKYNAEFIHGEDSTIMLSFTIGVDNDTIGPILDTLAARGILAHFFVTGDYAKNHPDVIWRILGEGHILGSHSYAHPEKGMNYLSVEEIVEDSMTMQNMIRQMYGYEMREYAFPSGFFSERALATVCQLGYHTVFYSFAYNDYMPSIETDAESALNRLLTELHPGAIYLLHGSSRMTAGVLGTFLDEAAARGYSFVF